jgi:hypothetical protein
VVSKLASSLASSRGGGEEERGADRSGRSEGEEVNPPTPTVPKTKVGGLIGNWLGNSSSSKGDVGGAHGSPRGQVKISDLGEASPSRKHTPHHVSEYALSPTLEEVVGGPRDGGKNPFDDM